MAPTVPSLPKLDLSSYVKHERADAAQNRRAILDAAESLRARAPIQEIAMTDLAKHVGIGQGTLYRRFESKAALAKTLLIKDFLASEEALHRRNRDVDEAPLDLLQWFAGVVIDVTLERADLITATAMVEDRAPGWWTDTLIAEWVVGTFTVLLEAVGVRHGARDQARTLITVLVFPGPLSSSEEIEAERSRFLNLVEIFAQTAAPSA